MGNMVAEININLIKLSLKIEVKIDIQHSNGAIWLIKSYDRNNVLGKN